MIYEGGVWPVMLTPFTEGGEIDIEGLAALTEWYINSGVKGLFAACQSSEIYSLSLAERIKIVETTIKSARGRVKVIASGHISDDMDSQVRELSAMAETGADAVILITNHLARADEGDDIWLENLDILMRRLDPAINLGAYECPHPYKRLLSPRIIARMAEVGRFYFIKDTCCDIDMILSRLDIIRGSNISLYNANTATLLDSLRAGARGFSGVMANMHPEIYAWLTENIHHKNAELVQSALTTAALIERQIYPVCAKYHLKHIEKLPITTYCRARDARDFDAGRGKGRALVLHDCRARDARDFNAACAREVYALNDLMTEIYEKYCVTEVSQ